MPNILHTQYVNTSNYYAVGIKIYRIVKWGSFFSLRAQTPDVDSAQTREVCSHPSRPAETDQRLVRRALLPAQEVRAPL